ncbi:DNA alkylation response protein [Permianibacter sp. IMCC34836]|uniref:acyl-CoA dehydrogenase family protein n=1 Tax=Permianibacter fluminis TaxID=2738515 RepID=UPI001557657C|nr:acyl-CoA dehydrogenase family protein [Permianibacter fluminis]NQD36977.1 DNA alkylation response protein [Permianibacter fluminis]
MSDTSFASTHQVFNQATALEPYHGYRSDRVLQHWLQHGGGNWAEPMLDQYGALTGTELMEAGRQANRFTPQFHSHDRFGNRIDLIEFHPAYHRLMQVATAHGHHSLPWREPKPGAHVARAALTYLHSQAEAGSGCPLTMTFASVSVLQQLPAPLRDSWLGKVLANDYDLRNLPYPQKTALTIGMAMTEKQGGSDVRANTTFAKPLAGRGNGELYRLVGHKWFCSAPMSDGFLVLAQTDAGLSCFLLPRWQPDGQKNAMEIQRLKDKLGNRANASSEIELRGAQAWLIGDEGRGIRTIMDMVALTRFDCVIGSAALMRQAVAQALQHGAGRHAFGVQLNQAPLMQNVLADLALESEAALALGIRLAMALDCAASNDSEKALVRIGTALAKFWVCKRAPQLIYEAMECLGGGGYVEDSVLPRLYREAPVNAIWEGSGNIQCLDVLRALQREPAAVTALEQELQTGRGLHPLLDQAIARALHWLSGSVDEASARRAVEQLVLAWQGVILQRGAPAFVADSFCAGRLAAESFWQFGSLPTGLPFAELIARSQPQH